MPIQSIQPALTTPEEQETLDVFLQRAQAAGLDPEEITSEVQSRYDIDLSGPMKAVQDLQETMGAAFTGGVPPGMREKTYSEEVLEPFATVGGIAEGALEAAGETLGPAMTEIWAGGGDPIKTPITQAMRRKAGEKVRAVKEDIEETFKQRHGQAGWENVRDDLTDNVEGILEIIRIIRGTEDFTPESYNVLEHLGGKFKEGTGTGRQFVHGAFADLLSLGDDPLLYARSRPVTTGMLIAGPLSEVNRLAKLRYAPAVKWVKSESGKKFNSVWEGIKRKTETSEMAVKARRKVQRTGRTISKKYGELQRFVIDPFIQPTQKASQLVESLIDTAKRTGAGVDEIAKRWAESIKRGYEDITPDRSPGVKIPFENAVDAVGPAKARERWNVGHAVKTLTQEIDYNPTTAHFGGRKEIAVILAEAFEDYKNGYITKQQYEKFDREVKAREAEPVFINVSNTHWNETVGRLVDDLDKLKHVDATEVIAILNKNLVDQAVGILRSKNMRNLVVEDILGQIREANIYTPEQLINLKEKLTKYLDDINKRDPEAPSFENNVIINFNSPAGPVQISIAKTVLKVLDETPKVRRTVYSELIANTAADIGADARLNVIAETLTDNMPIFPTDEAWIHNALETVILKGEELPPMIHGNPHQLATRMLDAIDKYASMIARSTDPELLALAKQGIREVAHKIRSYVRVPQDLINEFGVREFIETYKAQTPKQKRGPAKLEYEVFAPEGVIDTLQYELNAHKAVNEASGFWHWLNRGIKGNLTVRNLSSALNNIRANFTYQTFRRANPLLAVNLVDIIRTYHGFRTGKTLSGDVLYKISKAKRKFFEAMERTGYLKTTILDAELGGLGLSSIMPLPKVMTSWLEKFYQAGDNIFKLEDSWYNYKKLSKDTQQLQVGEHMTFEVKSGQRGTLANTADGWTLDGAQLTASQFADVLAQAASVPGLRIFFDYTRVANIIKWQRASKALGVTSPFFTWFWKAIDIPGVKRGLGRELFMDGVPYETNSKVLNTNRRKALALESLKKQVVITGMREAVKEPNNDKLLRKVISYAPQQFNLQLLEATTNPAWIGHDSEESANQFGPSDSIIRAIMSGQAIAEDDAWYMPWATPDIKESLKELYPIEKGRFGDMVDFDLSTIEDPEVKRDILIRRKILKKHHSGEALNWADTAALVAVSGTPILEGVIMLDEAGRQGGRVNKQKLFQLVTTALMGGTAAAILDIAVASLVDPDSPSKLFTTRRWAENEIDEPQEKFVKWSMRRITGIGFRPLDVGARSKWYFNKKETEWKNSLTGSLKQLLEDNPDLSPEDRHNMQLRIVELDRIVEGEIMLEKMYFDEVFEKLGKSARKKK